MSHSQKLFLFGLIVQLFYITILLNTDSIVSSFWKQDNGQLTQEISSFQVDSKSYIESANGFSISDCFKVNNNPDYHRTIGYPLIIYFFKTFFKQYWYYGLVIFQILLSSLIYPISYLIGIIIFPNKKKIVYYSAIFLILLGGYVTKSLYVLSDLPFTTFFLLGILFCLLSVIKKKNIFFIFFGIISLTFSALIRPNLILFPIAYLLLLIYISKQYNTWKNKYIKRIIWISTIILIITCNLSSLRIYNYYSNFSPTDILGINMFNYSVKQILLNEKQEQKYLTLKQTIDKENNWIIKDKLRKQYFFETVFKYPIPSIKYWIYAAQSHLLSPHFMEIGVVYGYYKRDISNKNKTLKKSKLMLIIFYFFYFVNIIITITCCLFLFRKLIVEKEYLFALTFFSLIFLIVGPSFIAQTSPRLRIPIEPFIIIMAFQYVGSLTLIRKKLNPN